MSFGIKKKGDKAKADPQGGMIKGKGTGTSDDVKKSVPSGSYIMPADSTKQIGEANLENMGSPKSVNLSNGEFQLTPDQVHSVGVEALDQMKGATHTPIDKPQLGFKPGKEEPELFFANGGLVPSSPYPSADEVRKANALRQSGGSTASNMKTISGVTGNVPGQSAPALPQPQTATPGAAAPPAGGFGAKAMNMAKSAGKGWSGLSAVGSLVNNAYTPSEQYRERFGIGEQSEEDLGTVKGFAKDFGVRALGYASDLGNALTFGQAGRGYQDLQRIANEQQQPKAAPTTSGNVANPFGTTQSAPKAPQPSFNDQLNQSLYGESPKQAPPQPRNADPYAINQSGNSFSYANPQAAAQARANGTPELQGSIGGVRRTNDPRGVQNLMNNTREMGPSQEMIEREVAKLQGQSNGFGVRYPDRPVRDDAQAAERANLARTIAQPIAGARGMTSSQRSQLSELQSGDDNRAVQMYNTDANNATSQTNNMTNNTASIAQTMMREQGSNQRAVLSEDGQNNRFGASLDFDQQKFKAGNDLDNRKFGLEQTKEGFGIRNSQRLEKLNEMYDKAQTDEQRQSISERINRLSGTKGESGKDRYMTVGGGQVWSQEASAMVNQKQQIFDTKTGKMLNMDGSEGQVSDSDFDSSTLEDGAVYQAPNGTHYRWDAKSQKAIPVQE